MDIKELRLGNLLQYENDKAIVKVYQLEHRYDNKFRLNDVDQRNDLEPIRLTEQWLRDFEISDFPFEIFGDNERGFHIALENGDWIFIYNVHQLQNLYFAITQKELTLTKPI